MLSRRRIRTSTQPTYQVLNSKIPTVNDNLQRGEPAFSLTKSLRPGGRTRRTSSVPPAQEKRQRMTASFAGPQRSEEHTSELQSLMRISYAVFCLTKTNKSTQAHTHQLPTATITISTT